jgi:transcriptional regulator with XRE-family HTH domain
MSRTENVPFGVVIEELKSDPEFKAAYDAKARLLKMGRLLRQARGNRNLTQKDVASKVGVAQSEVSRIESGEGVNGPAFDTFVSYAHAMGMDVIVELVERKSSDEAPENAESSSPTVTSPTILREAF